MKKAICPGSFCPVTKGHIDIFERASELFDEVTVLVVENPDKTCLFTVEERCEMIRKCLKADTKIRVEGYRGLLADYVKEHGINAIVKGLRSSSDFDYEFPMALANKALAPDAETVFLTGKPENMFVSSSLVRQVAAYGGDISAFVPEEIVELIEQKFKNEI